MKTNERLVDDVSKACRRATNQGLPIQQVGFTLLQGALAILLEVDTREEAAGLMFSLGEDVRDGRFPEYPNERTEN